MTSEKKFNFTYEILEIDNWGGGVQIDTGAGKIKKLRIGGGDVLYSRVICLGEIEALLGPYSN